MECCSTIYMPVRNDYLSERKILEFETYFYGIGMSKMLDRIEKVRLPECESGVDREFWEKIKSGGMYRFVKKILERSEKI